jgi:pimeloyl-ACP methyl ester carboxylesterase
MLALCFASGVHASQRLHAEGSGQPVVIFEAGLGDDASVWRQVQGAVGGGCGRMVSYSRAGYGFGAAAKGKRDAEHIVTELRKRLADSGLAPPYVLVGHSLGGLYVQYFARAYPGEVLGLVLVDSTHWDQLARIKAEAPSSYRLIRVASMMMTGAARKEFQASEATGREVTALPPSAVPTIVLSSTQAGAGEGTAFRALAARLQREIAAQYATVRHEFVANSGHYIQRDQPAVVAKAVQEIVGCAPRQAPGG